jgi:hypothetical protein
MKLPFTRLTVSLPLLLMMTGIAPLAASAQENGVIPTTNKVLVVVREYTKPGKDGDPHQKTEGAFIQALQSGNGAPRYYAVTSVSGQSRALFLSSYPNFAAWEAERKSVMSNPTLSAALDRANEADGDLLSETDSSVLTLRDDLSLNTGFRIGSRMMEISTYEVKPGHDKEWEELVKLVIDGYKKGIPDAHWGMYKEAYGSPGGRYAVLTTLKSAADIDAEFASGKKFEDAMGEDGMKKMRDLEASCIASYQGNLFVIDPKMSYPPDAFVKAEPDFWKPKQ